MLSFRTIAKSWKDYSFEILLAVTLTALILVGFYRRITGKKGSWSKTYFWAPDTGHKGARAPPKESRGEVECRRVLEKTFSCKFSKDRPDFLRNPVTGGNFNLELDCYNSGMALAVEYNGAQHYKYIPYFHKNKEAFYNQKYRDDMKRRLCRDASVNLIEVPYTIQVDKIEGYLRKELRRLGYLKS